MCVFLQLCPEDDGKHRETDGSSESQVRVKQQSEDEGDQPDHLERKRERRPSGKHDYKTELRFNIMFIK